MTDSRSKQAGELQQRRGCKTSPTRNALQRVAKRHDDVPDQTMVVRDDSGSTQCLPQDFRSSLARLACHAHHVSKHPHPADSIRLKKHGSSAAWTPTIHYDMNNNKTMLHLQGTENTLYAAMRTMKKARPSVKRSNPHSPAKGFLTTRTLWRLRLSNNSAINSWEYVCDAS